MINFIKKSTLTAAMLFCTIAMFAQTPFSGSSEFRKFSIGINGGALMPSNLFGGYNDFTKSTVTLGYGANLKYQLNHYLALQADFLKGKVKGDNSRDFADGTPATVRPIYAFETDIDYAATLSAVFTFGNVNWLKKQTVVLPYVSVGGGLIKYSPKTMAKKGGTFVDFNSTTKEVNRLVVPIGMGLKFMLSNAINLDLGYRQHIVDWDNFDGTEYLHGNNHKDKFSYAFLGLEFALGKSGSRQLMFDNPAARMNDLLQTQVTNINNRVDSLAAQRSLVDSDGDGVPDQFDKEPNTPAGYPVDFRGVSLDTDGDGVPDGRDKELITPTNCQPVDADGVGKCPDPACCTGVKASACDLGNMPSISFSGSSLNLSNDAKAMLATVASKLKSSAGCTITVTGYPAASKASQSLSNRRISAVKSYLSEMEGISADRVMVNTRIGGGDSNVIDITAN
jgi:opacity protein-like surface antigen/outer membrane protein OmpA-like peptidoglycan-associated protein